MAGVHEVSELEAPLEGARGDTAMQIVALAVILGAFAGDGELVLLRHHLDVFGAKAGDCQRDAIAVLAILQDVEGRIAIVFTRACFEQVEQAIEAYGRAPIGRENQVRSEERRGGKGWGG